MSDAGEPIDAIVSRRRYEHLRLLLDALTARPVVRSPEELAALTIAFDAILPILDRRQEAVAEARLALHRDVSASPSEVGDTLSIAGSVVTRLMLEVLEIVNRQLLMYLWSNGDEDPGRT